jgi:hypothetical protein
MKKKEFDRIGVRLYLCVLSGTSADLATMSMTCRSVPAITIGAVLS